MTDPPPEDAKKNALPPVACIACVGALSVVFGVPAVFIVLQLLGVAVAVLPCAYLAATFGVYLVFFVLVALARREQE